jgi:hypothetical protein
MQRCKSAGGLCKGAKVDGRITEYGVQSTECGGRREGRGVASPRPCFDRRARRSLAPTRERSSREAARLARSANPTRYGSVS